MSLLKNDVFIFSHLYKVFICSVEIQNKAYTIEYNGIVLSYDYNRQYSYAILPFFSHIS